MSITVGAMRSTVLYCTRVQRQPPSTGDSPMPWTESRLTISPFPSGPRAPDAGIDNRPPWPACTTRTTLASAAEGVGAKGQRKDDGFKRRIRFDKSIHTRVVLVGDRRLVHDFLADASASGTSLRGLPFPSPVTLVPSRDHARCTRESYSPGHTTASINGDTRTAPGTLGALRSS